MPLRQDSLTSYGKFLLRVKIVQYRKIGGGAEFYLRKQGTIAE
jgi:hypothetical protein